MRRCYTRLDGLAVILALLASTGCTPKHTNMLIFVTDTKIALDVSASATNAVPQITLGYRREEVALVPLLANAPANADLSVNGTATANGCPQSGTATETDNDAPPSVCAGAGYVFKATDMVSGKVTHTDAYSTIASFGATFDSSASTSAAAKGSIATFFATGVAAQKLAEQGGAQLVSTSAATASATTISTDTSRSALVGGLMNKTGCQAAVITWMQANKIPADEFTVFANGKAYDTQRAQALQDPAVKAACT